MTNNELVAKCYKLTMQIIEIEKKETKERYFCDVCNDTFEGEPGKHVNDVHGEEYHSSESMIDFEERHISEVD